MRLPAANDDRESIGSILRLLQQTPSKTSYLIASIFAAVWIIAGFGLGLLYVPEIQRALGPTGLTAPVLAVLAAIYLAPVVLFYVLAHMAVRSQEMRLIAQSMAEVAMRLAEPETVARESIVTVGQAIRREVAAMGDGVERALARAAELETLVANEVSALEHAYTDNEVRIRALLQDLGSQRDTLVGQAEAVRDAINGVHLDLSNDISQISQLVAEQVNEAARRITHTLAEKGEHITRALGSAGDTMIEQLGERGGDLLERLESTGRSPPRSPSCSIMVSPALPSARVMCSPFSASVWVMRRAASLTCSATSWLICEMSLERSRCTPLMASRTASACPTRVSRWLPRSCSNARMRTSLSV